MDLRRLVVRKWRLETPDVIAAGAGTHRLQNRQLHQQTHVNERARPPPPRAAPDGRAVPPRHLDAFKKTTKKTR